MTVRPGQKGTFGVEEVPHPDLHDGALLVQPEDIKVVVELTA